MLGVIFIMFKCLDIENYELNICVYYYGKDIVRIRVLDKEEVLKVVGVMI